MKKILQLIATWIGFAVALTGDICIVVFVLRLIEDKIDWATYKFLSLVLPLALLFCVLSMFSEEHQENEKKYNEKLKMLESEIQEKDREIYNLNKALDELKSGQQ